MNIDLLNYICCPFDHSEDWDVQKNEKKEVTAIVCKKCNRRFPVIEGILSIMPDDFYKSSDHTVELKRIEQKVRDDNAEHYLSWFGQYTHRIEYDHILKELNPVDSDVILDVGCGIGRITIPLASQVRKIIGLDYSLRSIILLKKELKKRHIDNVLLLQADATFSPLKKEIFDKILSNQVITFIPSKKQRLTALDGIFQSLKPGAILVFTVFNYHLFRKYYQFRGYSGAFYKEGTHPGLNFYYFNYKKKELENELKQFNFSKIKIYGICNFPREKVIRLDISGVKKWIYGFDKFLSSTFLSNFLGDLLLVRVIKK